MAAKLLDLGWINLRAKRAKPRASRFGGGLRPMGRVASHQCNGYSDIMVPFADAMVNLIMYYRINQCPCGQSASAMICAYFFQDSKEKNLKSSGKKSKSVFDFFTYLRQTWISFSYQKVLELIPLNERSNEINRISKYDNSLSFGNKYFLSYEFFFYKKFL